MLTSKYRPKSLDEIIGQDSVVKTLKQLKEKQNFPHLLFTGPPGSGKTSCAYAFASELNIPIVELNASDERGIETVRSKIKNLTFSSGQRIILLDEFDSMTEIAQEALRRIIELSPPNVKFIATANNVSRVIDPIKSRFLILYFNKLDSRSMAKISLRILKSEGIIPPLTPEIKQAVEQLVDVSDGDARFAVNVLDSLISENKLITSSNVLLLSGRQDVGGEILVLALDGKIEEAIRRLEDLYIEQRLSGRKTISDIFSSLKKSEKLSLEEKLILFSKLAEVEHRINEGGDVLLQLSSFLADLY
ncbi:MAG: AAA family ATPase, partial [Caldisericaceae bacterium]